MHNKEPHIDYDLLMRFLTKEADAQQLNEVEKWLSTSEENRLILDKLEKLWIESGKIIPAPVAVDKQMAWDKVLHRIKTSEEATNLKQAEKPRTIRMFRNISRIAAVFIIVIGAFFVYNYVNRPLKELTLESGNELLSQVLPDESKIDLNENSKILYPEKFKGGTREVFLEGEAFFDISPNAEKPFIIHTEIADITVLGTSFNVKVYQETKRIEVLVESGTVRLSNNTTAEDSEAEIILERGMMGVFDENTGEFEKIITRDKNKLFWKTNKLTFKDQRLGDIFNLLEDHFDVSIKRLNPAIDNCHLTVNFEDNELDYILSVIAATAELIFQKENGVYNIQGDGCE